MRIVAGWPRSFDARRALTSSASGPRRLRRDHPRLHRGRARRPDPAWPRHDADRARHGGGQRHRPRVSGRAGGGAASPSSSPAGAAGRSRAAAAAWARRTRAPLRRPRRRSRSRRCSPRSRRRFGRLDLLFNNAGVGAPGGAARGPRPRALGRRRRHQPDRRLPLHAGGVPDHEAPVTRAAGGSSTTARSRRSVPRPLSAPYTATKHAITGLTQSTSLDGRAYDIACGQIDIGNAATELTEPMRTTGVLQADGTIAARADDRRRARRPRGRLHGDPAARRQRPVHDGDGDQDAVHRPRLSSCPGIRASARSRASDSLGSWRRRGGGCSYLLARRRFRRERQSDSSAIRRR